MVGLALVALGPAAGVPLPVHTAVVSAHSQLVSSDPGAGDVVATAPAQIRLVFSEPIEGRYSSMDVLDPVGKTILLNAGTVDPADDHALVATVPALAPGSYTVNWRNVSAADGHASSGFITFGVGTGSSGGQGTGTAGGVGDLHSGHSGTAAISEVEGKTAGYGGLMLVLGIALLVALFGRVVPRATRSAARAVWVLLLVAASGTLVLLIVGAASLPTETGLADVDLPGYALTSRVGLLLTLRTVLALAGAGIAFLAARVGRPGLAVAVGGVVAAVGLALAALGGHAAGFDSPVPLVVDVVHLGAASIWLAGVVGLFWLLEFGGLGPDELRALVPRFSAVALVSVVLIALTGMYEAWIETYDFTSIGTPYSLTLAAKIAVFGVALVIGALNYWDGGRDQRWLGGFRTRIFLEAGFAVAVIGLAANLTSGAPTGEGRPIPIAEAVGTGVPGAYGVSLAVQPGRPGPNRYVAEFSPALPAGTTAELDLQRLDQDTGLARLPMRPTSVATISVTPGSTGRGVPEFVADAGQLPEGSRWDAQVVVSDALGREVGRRRFTFAVGSQGITEGRAVPPIDPALWAGILLLGLGLAALAFGLAGGRLPRAAAGASRAAMLGGGVVGCLVGLAILSGGPR